MKKTNIIHPGYIISRNDGDKHFIGYQQLMRLYHLDPSTCMQANSYGQDLYSEDIKHYYPDYTGRYGRDESMSGE